MQLDYTVKGKFNGSKIVLVHGWAKTASIDSLAPLQKELVEKGFRVWNIELPGFGNSKNAPSDWGTGEFAKEVAKFIKTNVTNGKSAQYYLFGHSFGGSLTAYITANLWPKPEKIILCSSAGLRYKTPKALILMPIAKAAKLPLYLLPSTLREKVKKGFYYYLLRERDYIDSSVSKAKKEQFIRVTNQDLKEIFKKIKTPTLIIWGRQDKITPLKMGIKINKLIKSSKLKIIEGRHGIPITRTKKVANLVEKFLEQ
jgi:pimeloyl-ACP methyl ester carboxylesterase